MKLLSKLILMTILFFIIILSVSVLLAPSEIKSYGKLKDKFIIQKLVFDSDLNIYSTNNFYLTEEELNSLATPHLKDSINSSLSSENLKLDKLYIDTTSENNFLLKGKIKKIIPIGLNIRVAPEITQDTIALEIKEIKLGKIPISSSLLNKSTNKTLKLKNPLIEGILLKDLNISENKINITYKPDVNALIKEYIKGEHKKTLISLVDLLGQNDKTQSFANDIVKILLLESNDIKTPDYLIKKLKNDFLSLNPNTKRKILYILLEHEMDYIINILKENFFSEMFTNVHTSI